MIYTTSEDPRANALPLQSMNLQNALLKPAQIHCCLPVLEVVHLEKKHLNISTMLVMIHAKCISMEFSVMTDFHKS